MFQYNNFIYFPHSKFVYQQLGLNSLVTATYIIGDTEDSLLALVHYMIPVRFQIVNMA